MSGRQLAAFSKVLKTGMQTGEKPERQEYQIAKSALQKFIRRGLTDEACQIIVWWVRSGLEVKKLSARLVVIAAEDIGSFTLLEQTLRACWEAEAHEKAGATMHAIRYLCGAAKALSEFDSKTRLADEIWILARNQNYYKLKGAQNIVLHPDIETVAVEYLSGQNNDAEKVSWHTLGLWKMCEKEGGEKRYWEILERVAIAKGLHGLRVLQVCRSAAKYGGFNGPIFPFAGLVLAAMPPCKELADPYAYITSTPESLPCVPWFCVDQHTKVGKAIQDKVAAEFNEQLAHIKDMLFYSDGTKVHPAAPDALDTKKALFAIWEERWWGANVSERWKKIRVRYRQLAAEKLLELGFRVYGMKMEE